MKNNFEGKNPINEIVSFLEKYKSMVNLGNKEDEGAYIRLLYKEKPDGEGIYDYQQFSISFENGEWLMHETNGDSRMVLTNMDRDEKNIIKISEKDAINIIQSKQKEGFELSIGK